MSLSSRFETVFGQLVDAWTNHQELRARGAAPGELFSSRLHLDEVRHLAAQARSAELINLQ